jgi:hypothetical protein
MPGARVTMATVYYLNPDGTLPTVDDVPVLITQEQFEACCCALESCDGWNCHMLWDGATPPGVAPLDWDELKIIDNEGQHPSNEEWARDPSRTGSCARYICVKAGLDFSQNPEGDRDFTISVVCDGTCNEGPDGDSLVDLILEQDLDLDLVIPKPEVGRYMFKIEFFMWGEWVEISTGKTRWRARECSWTKRRISIAQIIKY